MKPGTYTSAPVSARISKKLTEHAESRQIDLRNVRLWMTHSENPPASSGFGKLLRRRANPSDTDEEHWRKTRDRGPVVTVGAGLGGSRHWRQRRAEPCAGDAAGFTITGFEGDLTGSFYIGLGPEAAAAECFSALRSAITAAENATDCTPPGAR